MIKRIINISTVILLLTPFVILAQNPTFSNKKLTILTLGDSNGTFPMSWPQQLTKAFPNAKICNISKSGRTIGFLNLGDSTLNSLFVIDQNLKKAAAFTGNTPYDFVIIELGTNDAKAVFDNQQKEVPQNLNKLINKIKDSPYTTIKHAKIIIISPPPYGAKAENTVKYAGGNQRVEAMSKAFKKVANRQHCFFVNGFSTPGLNIETMTTDGIHLDSLGSRKLIEPVISLLAK